MVGATESYKDKIFAFKIVRTQTEVFEFPGLYLGFKFSGNLVENTGGHHTRFVSAFDKFHFIPLIIDNF
jgi:hypothetical protein